MKRDEIINKSKLECANENERVTKRKQIRWLAEWIERLQKRQDGRQIGLEKAFDQLEREVYPGGR